MGSTVIGIDLGTTNTCVACYSNGQVKVLINEEGGRITPSFIYVTEKDKIIVGLYAQKMANSKPEYGICELKRLIGRKFDDSYVQNNLQYFPFSIISVNNEPVVSVRRKEDIFERTPAQLCGAILKKIKTDAESKLGESINKAVITVPAYFNVSQREATLSAAKEAGLTVMKLLNEPTAAALSYYLEHNTEENYSLVYDLGGGTFDVAIIKRNINNNIDIVGVDGDTHLGGHDFDNLLVDYVCNHLLKKFNYNPKGDRRAMRRLHGECEEAKRTLSMTEDTTIVLIGYVKDNPTIEIEISRKQFEKMCDDLFKKTIIIVDNCIKSCKLTKTDIKEVILSGGSTRIPKLQKMISSFFGGKKLNKFVNPDECVAEGAALQAAMLSSNSKQHINSIRVRDVIPLSLGISNFVNLMTFCIQKNTPIPVSTTLNRITIDNLQKAMSFDVYEGERLNATKNRHLGTVTISGLTPAPPGQCHVFFTMSIDENGILKVKAKEKHKNNVKNLTIVYTRGDRSDKEVKNALKDAEDHKLEDERFTNFAALKGFVLGYCERAKYNFEAKKLVEKYKDLYELCKTIKKEAVGMGEDDEERLEDLENQITTACDNIALNHNFEFMPN